MKDPLYLLVIRLLSKNKISYDKKELSFQIKSHPSYPSLHAITGVLDHFNIDNIAAEVPVNSETLQQLPDHFIAQVTSESEKKLVTVSKNKLGYIIFSETTKDNSISEDDFLKIFTGIIVAVEKDEHVQSSSTNNLKKIILLTSLTVLVGILLVYKNTNISSFSFIILSIIGVITSQSILKQEFGENTLIGDTFCSSNNEKKDCDAVLSSKGAEIFKDHKLSDLSILYFTGLLLSTLFINNFNILYLISFITIPITLYSVYYQKYIVKSWCALCLSIVAVLWFQATLAFTQTNLFTAIFNLDIYDIIITVISFTTTYVMWDNIKPLYAKSVALQKDKIEAVKFKRNFNLFENLLKKSPTINTKIQDTNEIILGNKNVPLELVFITNPFCGHCKAVHKMTHKIVEKYHDLVKIIIRFNVPVDNLESNSVIVTTKLIELYHEKGEDACKKAMNDIYGDMKLNQWLSKWKKTTNINLYYKTLQDEKEWCNENAINFTPEILINGKSYPKEYKREDLLFFIEDLEEETVLVTQ